jgi:hypothetical protein
MGASTRNEAGPPSSTDPLEERTSTEIWPLALAGTPDNSKKAAPRPLAQPITAPFHSEGKPTRFIPATPEVIRVPLNIHVNSNPDACDICTANKALPPARVVTDFSSPKNRKGPTTSTAMGREIANPKSFLQRTV